MNYDFIIDTKTQKLISMAKQFNKQNAVYPQIVERLIEQKYTVKQELSISRQRDKKPQEFEEYDTYCEACKQYAKELLGIE